jgi:hypothetical protein
MLTEANFAANLITARRNAGIVIGLADFDGSAEATRALGYEDLRRLNVALANIILQYPNSFDAGRVQAARSAVLGADGPLVDSSFAYTEFADETLANAVPVLGGFTNKLLLIAALGLVAWVVMKNWPPGPKTAAA